MKASQEFGQMHWIVVPHLVQSIETRLKIITGCFNVHSRVGLDVKCFHFVDQCLRTLTRHNVPLLNHLDPGHHKAVVHVPPTAHFLAEGRVKCLQ